jgi:hypothetical protein
MKTRKQLAAEVVTLKAQLAAAHGGESRKNMRERIARLAKENDELKATLAKAGDQVELLKREANETITALRERLAEANAKVKEMPA